MNARIGAAVCCAFLFARPAQVLAQGTDGYVSLLADVLPNVRFDTGDDRRVSELRARVFADSTRELGTRVRVRIAGFAEGLVAARLRDRTTTAGIVRPQELYLEASWPHADVRVGLTRVVWGRLDEFLPTDVVNPQDLTRFFLEGRSEGRMPAAMVRARWLASDAFRLEGLYLPWFRRGRFDELDEPTSPFNPTPRTVCLLPTQTSCLPIAYETPTLAAGGEGAQGGARASITTGRVDWALSVFRGREPLPVYDAAASPVQPGDAVRVAERFPRFTMIGGDFETVRGDWGVRGEAAFFQQRRLQLPQQAASVDGRALEAGVGIDRKAGAYRVTGNAILSRRWQIASPLPGAPDADRTDVTLVAAADRSFARETRTLRAFAVYNPAAASGFVRVIGAISLRDDVWLEGSGGWFRGDGEDILSRFDSRDFLYARLKVFF